MHSLRTGDARGTIRALPNGNQKKDLPTLSLPTAHQERSPQVGAEADGANHS